MIEIVCKDGLQEEKKEGNISLPRNIRQVGSPGGRHKIYIEDYVYTYLKTIAGKKESCAAVFLGKSQVAKDIRYTFVNGALECGSGVFQWDKICLDEGFWKNLEKEQKKYFPDREIVGWFLGKAGQAMELSPAVEAAHRKYFSGRDKVLMLLDVLEEEEIFFIYDQGYLQKREGYYIYYEKNLPMQEYMIHKRDEEQRLEELAVFKDSETEGLRAEASELESGSGLAETEDSGEETSHAGFSSSKQERKHAGTDEAKQERKHAEIDEAKQERKHAEIGDAKQERKLAGIGDVTQEGTHAGIDEAKQKGKHAEIGDAKQERTHGEIDGAKQKGTHGEIGGAKTERTHAGMNDITQERAHGGIGDSEQRNSQLKLEEFRKLRKELRGETGGQEKIFARSNLEEPKTQAEEALESYRNMMVTRHGRQVERQNRRFLYTASSFFLVAVCVLGITTINNYRKMQEVEDVLHVMRSGESTQKRSENQDGVVVESVESQVEPLEEGQQTGDGKEQAPGNVQSDQPAASADGKSEGEAQDSKGAQSGDQNAAQTGATAGNSDSGQSGGTEGNAGGAQSGETAENQGSGQAEGTEGNADGAQSGGTAENPDSGQPGGASNSAQIEGGQSQENQTLAPAQETSAEQPRYYTVQPGDTLASICINIYHSRDMMKKVCEVNGIEDGDKIYAGQKLLLP